MSTWTLSLADVITDLCIRAGINATQIDVTQLSGTPAVPPAVTELTNPSVWGSTGGGDVPGKDVMGAYLDTDGVSAWLFQYFGAGFARVNLLTNTIIGQGNWFNNPGAGSELIEREEGVQMWLQDDAGHYYTIYVSDFSNPYGSSHAAIYKIHVGSSSAASFGNGYLAVDATIDGSTLTPVLHSFESLQDWKYFKSGGLRYIAFSTGNTLWVINADTMTFVGSYVDAAGFNSGSMIAIDNSGDLWFVVSKNVPTNNVRLVKWHPPAGATGTSLNVTTTDITVVLDGIQGISFSTYVPAINAILMGNTESSWTGSVTVITLSPIAVVATQLDDGQFFFIGEFDPALAACDVGVQGSGNGVLAIPGDLPESGPNTGVYTQCGGILNLIDPVTLALLKTYNITALINAAPVTPVPTGHNNDRDQRTITSASADGVHATYVCANDFIVGQKARAFSCTPSSLNGGGSYLTITSASPTQYSVALAVTVAPTGQSGAFARIEATMPNCFADMRYSQALNGVLCTYNQVGSAPYWITLGLDPVPGQTVRGYLLTNQTDAKAALQNLLAAYFIDAVESDFKIKFVPRGANAAALTIPEVDLGLQSDKSELTEQTAQEQDLPREVSVLFIDPSIDWQQNKSQKHRHRRGIKTKQLTTMQLPMVFTPEEARQIAEKSLYLAYLEGKPFSFHLWKALYMKLDPTDIVDFIYQNNTFQTRLANSTIGVDYTAQLNGVSDDPNNYLSNPVAGAAEGVPANVPNPPAPTVLFLLDIPYLQDSDAVPDRSSTGFYAAMSSTEPTWSGGVLDSSSDGTNYDAINSSAERTLYGTCLNTLGAPPSLWTWDNVNTLDIQMLSGGTLSGTTDANVLNGTNILIVGGEVIQYVNAVQISAGVYRISRLLRGRRNTEYAAFTHGVSEYAFDPTTGIFRQSEPLALIGLARSFKGVTVGADIIGVSPQTLTLAPGDLKPASPTRLTGVRDISANLTIGWIRRTRYAGDWLNNVGTVPLNEDTEAYEIDIYNGLAVVRTIVWTPGTYDGSGNPTAAYSAAQQTTDFGSPQVAIAVKIYQMSAQVGRGFPAAATI